MVIGGVFANFPVFKRVMFITMSACVAVSYPAVAVVFVVFTRYALIMLM